MTGENQPCMSEDIKMKTLSDSRSERLNDEEAAPPTRSCGSKFLKILKTNLILVLTIAGIFGGVALGIVGRIFKPSADTLVLISFPGELLLRILKMLILPLIISSLISGLAQLDPKSSGKMGSRALAYYMTTTVIATITGISVALIVHPGSPDSNKINRVKKTGQTTVSLSTLDAMLDIIRNMFPENVVQACSQQLSTSYKTVKKVIATTNLTNASNMVEETIEYVTVRELKYIDGTNVMGLVVFCTIFGIFISNSKSEAQIISDFFRVLNELIMKIVALVMWYSPIGILFLVASNIIKIDNMADTAKRLSFYMMTVLLGLSIHLLGTIQLLYFLTTRKNPLRFLKGMLQAWLTAIGTASSAATLPITFRCLEENNKVDKRVTRFMLPLGATVNMDGLALYQCVASLFIAQINGISLTFGQIITLSLSSTATSIGCAAIPSAGLVTMLIVLSTVGLPTEDISYIVAVDWLLDRFRTSVNVLGDAYGCGVVAHLLRKDLKKLDDEDKRTQLEHLEA